MKNKSIILLLFILVTLTSSIPALAGDDTNPLFVTITAKSCYSCQKLKPVVESLKESYSDRITFLTLDVSSKSSIDESREIADQYGVSDFFENNKSTLPKVGIICPGGKKVEKEFLGEINQEVYVNALDELLADSYQICSL